jgi:AcrR family transcriptional regulator
MIATATSVPRKTRAPNWNPANTQVFGLVAVSELLDTESDVEGLSVRMVTRRAGVSPTALYLHFADLDELVRAVKAECFGALGAAVARCLNRDEGDSRVVDATFVVWLGLHGRAGVARTMPWMTLPDEGRLIAMLVDAATRPD